MFDSKISTVASFVESIERKGGIDRSRFGLRLSPPSKDLVGFDSEHGNFAFGCEVVNLFYKDFDGQDAKTGELKLFGEFQFMGLKQAQQDWRDMFDACGRQEAGFYAADFYDERVKDGIGWRKNWFPFGIDINSIRNLIIDFDPSLKGTPGQIFALGNSDQAPRFLATSFAEFLQMRLSEMEKSNFSLEDDYISPLVVR